jgi:MYXO-CTERM domain-containing protein
VKQTGHATGKGCGAVLATVAVGVLVLLRRRKLERHGELG